MVLRGSQAGSASAITEEGKSSADAAATGPCKKRTGAARLPTFELKTKKNLAVAAPRALSHATPRARLESYYASNERKGVGASGTVLEEFHGGRAVVQDCSEAYAHHGAQRL
jgi:hypothetical protein